MSIALIPAFLFTNVADRLGFNLPRRKTLIFRNSWRRNFLAKHF